MVDARGPLEVGVREAELGAAELELVAEAARALSLRFDDRRQQNARAARQRLERVELERAELGRVVGAYKTTGRRLSREV